MSTEAENGSAAAERLAELVRIPTVSAERDHRGEAPFAELRERLAALYPLVHASLERELIGSSGLLYRWRGQDDSRPIVLMAHYDVVPADQAEGWRHDPFGGVIDEGYVWGRGTLDDKGQLVLVLEAVEALLASGFTPAQDVYLSFGGDEETAGESGKLLAATLAERGIRPWLVLDEGGAVVDSPFPGLAAPLAVVGLAEKGLLTLKVTARGDAGHASAPPRHTPVTRLLDALARVNRRQPFPARIPETFRGMLRAIAAETRGPLRFVYGHPRLFSPVLKPVFERMGGEAAAMLRTTVALTMLDAGTAHNVLPSTAQATFNIRISPGDSVDSVVETMRRRLADDSLELEALDASEPSPVSSADGPAFAAIARAVAAGYPDAVTAPYLMVAASDARHFHRRFPEVFRISPLRMSPQQLRSIHGVDERVAVSSLAAGRSVYQALLRSLPTVP